MQYPNQKKAIHQTIKDTKQDYPHTNLAVLCGWFGISRQAYYQQGWRHEQESDYEDLILKRIARIRKRQSKTGGRKLYDLIKPTMEKDGIKMGRDAFFDLLKRNQLLIKRRKRYITTTQSNHRFRKHPNLITDFKPTQPNQLWVSDITYWKLASMPVYVSLITDAYSRKIVGYHVADSLKTCETLKALSMALCKNRINQETALIHHSDRGIQYCSNEYVNRLKKSSIGISMTQDGNPLHNAIAERINGILKHEFLLNYDVSQLEQAKKILKRSVKIYNNERPHLSLGYLKPNQVHRMESAYRPKPVWKNYYRKKTLEEVNNS